MSNQELVEKGETRNIHWKKVFQVRYEIEASIATVVEAFEISDTYHEKKKLQSPPKHHEEEWENVSLGKSQSGESRKGMTTQCSICKKAFTSRRLLDQHTTIAHRYQQAGDKPKEFCFLPCFMDRGIERASRRQEQKEDCSLCRKWLGGGVKKEDAFDPQDSGHDEKTMRSMDKRRGSKLKNTVTKACHLCPKILSNRKGLERHMLIHTGEKPFPCDVCGKPFRRKDNCVRHKKTAHLFKKPRKPRRRRGTVRNENSTAI